MIAGLIRLTRPAYTLGMVWAYLLTVYYARSARLEWVGDGWSGVALAMVVGGAYVLNDVADVAVDAEKGSARPLVAGEVSRRAALVFGVLLMAGGVAVAGRFAAGWFAGLLLAVAVALLIYDAGSKRLGVFKDIVVAMLVTSIYPLAAVQAGGFHGSRGATLPLFAMWMLLSSWAFEVFSDLADRKVDRTAGRALSPLQRHPWRWRRAGEIALVASALVLVAPMFAGCGWFYAMSVSALAGVPLVVGVRMRKPRSKMRAIYATFVGVGIATTMDVWLCR